jgi:hypothetical protein
MRIVQFDKPPKGRLTVVLFFNVVQIVVLYQKLVKETVNLPTIR